ncbi:DeoR family transcriptional regulator, partial [Lactobacillus helveticus]|uniref:DeoR family transcriptional regulator n=1 Tax=Lactobacillus helveticus TaxID=1587 RepID=UPI0035CC64A5
MNQEQHLLKIKELLKQRQHISTRELATYFKVSFDTARRDVIHLTSTGQAIRVHGGLMATRKSSIYRIAPSENVENWTEMLQDMKSRGLEQVELFLSD